MPELAPKLEAIAQVQGPWTWMRGLLCRIHMIVTKISKTPPLLKGTMVHGTWSFNIEPTNSFGSNFIWVFALV